MLKDKICDDPLTEYEKPLLELNKLDPIEPKKVEFIIITEKNAAAVFRSLKEKGIDPVLKGLTDNGYEILSENYLKMILFMAEQGDQLEAYKKHYESDNPDDYDNSVTPTRDDTQDEQR